MNNRIRELAEQAGAAADYGVTGVEDENYLIMSGEDIDKFAELIVRECAKLVEDNMDPQNAWINPGVIKEHFGVEE
jgi:hypothetical protein